ncbi:CU044_5270 family protein [Embleya sp. MST-111070]|uniref:CU044_5270 family protein n=1 Tax=Embleya sp. MST-111070 TaxID=3398231 RepID=UPI003F73D07A
MTHPPRPPGTPSCAEAAEPTDVTNPGDNAIEAAPAHDARPTSERRRLLEEHLMREITEDLARSTTRRPALGRRVPRFVAPLGAAGAVLAVVTAVALLGTPGSGASGPGRTPTIRADSATAPTIPRPGQVLYTESESSSWPDSDASPRRIPPHIRKEWVSQDGRRVFIDEPGAGLHGLSVSDPPLRWNYLEPAASVPTPDALTAAIRQRNADTPGEIDQEAFREIASVLSRGVLPPGMPTALFEAASRLTGVERTDDAVDARGRHGIGPARTDPRGGVRTELVLDPTSRLLLGSRGVLTHPDENHPIGTVVWTSTVLKRDIIDTMPADPTAGINGSHTFSIAPKPRS